MAVAGADVARALPDDASCPPWARFGRSTWVEADYRLIVPLYDARGDLVSVRARRVLVDERKVPKALPPPGYNMRGAIMANPTARAVLAAGCRPAWWPAGLPVRLVVTEGEPDFLTWSTSPASSGPSGVGVFGVMSGTWTPDLAARIPSGARVTIRTHDDPTGDKFATLINTTLAARCTVLRAV